jgi:hypothetical protein
MLERWGQFYDRIDRGTTGARLGARRPWTVLAWRPSCSSAACRRWRHGHRVRAREDRGEYEVLVEMPPGTSFEESVARGGRSSGQSGGFPRSADLLDGRRQRRPAAGERCGQDHHKLDERERGLAGHQGRHAARLATLPLLKTTVADPEFMQGAPNEAPINVYVRGTTWRRCSA